MDVNGTYAQFEMLITTLNLITKCTWASVVLKVERSSCAGCRATDRRRTRRRRSTHSRRVTSSVFFIGHGGSRLRTLLFSIGTNFGRKLTQVNW